MTEAEWLTCTEPEDMVRHIMKSSSAVRSKAGRRKLRLYACACCRQIWNIIPDDCSRRAVEVAEQFADGLVDRATFQVAALVASKEANRLWQITYDECGVQEGHPSYVRWRAARVVELACEKEIVGSSVSGPIIAKDISPRGFTREKRIQAGLVRDLYGNPFQSPAALGGWLGKRDGGGVIVGLAQAAYEQRPSQSGELDCQRMGVLADALEEAGCTDEAILSHLRSAGPHVRGCWALDLILGKP
jgi:hypothetical protein